MPKFSDKIFIGGLKVKISCCMVSGVHYKEYAAHIVLQGVCNAHSSTMCVCDGLEHMRVCILTLSLLLTVDYVRYNICPVHVCHVLKIML